MGPIPLKDVIPGSNRVQTISATKFSTQNIAKIFQKYFPNDSRIAKINRWNIAVMWITNSRVEVKCLMEFEHG